MMYEFKIDPGLSSTYDLRELEGNIRYCQGEPIERIAMELHLPRIVGWDCVTPFCGWCGHEAKPGTPCLAALKRRMNQWSIRADRPPWDRRWDRVWRKHDKIAPGVTRCPRDPDNEASRRV